MPCTEGSLKSLEVMIRRPSAGTRALQDALLQQPQERPHDPVPADRRLPEVSFAERNRLARR
jgi:hypothetical protein